jgi:hypothetical protein
MKVFARSGSLNRESLFDLLVRGYLRQLDCGGWFRLRFFVRF